MKYFFSIVLVFLPSFAQDRSIAVPAKIALRSLLQASAFTLARAGKSKEVIGRCVKPYQTQEDERGSKGALESMGEIISQLARYHTLTTKVILDVVPREAFGFDLEELVGSGCIKKWHEWKQGNFLSKIEINLSNRQLKNIEYLKDLKNKAHTVESLVLCWNQLTSEVLAPIALFTNLKELDCVYNRITTFPDNLLAHMTSLRNLRLTGNSALSLSEKCFRHSSNLEYLDLQSCKISQLPEKIFETLINLNYLNIGSGELHRLPASFSKLEKLKILIARENQLINIDSLGFCYSLEKVDLYGNKLESLPSLQLLTNLQQVDLRYNPIKITCNDFKGITSLRRLVFSDNNRSVHSFKDLPNLDLYISMNDSLGSKKT